MRRAREKEGQTAKSLAFPRAQLYLLVYVGSDGTGILFPEAGHHRLEEALISGAGQMELATAPRPDRRLAKPLQCASAALSVA